ncbi:tetratricopeptide repeat protein [Streptomyces sp. NPDC059631]|uniref:tetratricopeptide repeat protein n=1 Tax=unclassified Streptomyces TaxID=2593676 RepID=UPI0036B33206
MEKPAWTPEPAPAPDRTPEPAMRPARGGRPTRRTAARILVALAVLGGAAGAVLLARPAERSAVRPATPGAPGGARTARLAGALDAVTAGVPAALPALTELIADRERRVRAHPGDARAWAVLGAAYVERARRTADPGGFPAAERALRTSLRLSPEHNADATAALAALALGRRDFPTARTWAQQALASAPGRGAAYALLIAACTGTGDHKAVGRYLEQLLKADHSPAARARAAAVYRDRGWREDAAAQLTDAVAAVTGPAERAAYLEQSGRYAWERGDLDEAQRSFTAALRLDPARRDALAGRARTLASLGRSEEAVAAYRRALGDRPRPEHLLELGELYESLGQDGPAGAQFERVRERAGQEQAAGVDTALVLGRLEADHGDPEEAVRGLREEWRRQPGTAVADALGWALHRAGQDQEALEFATTATEEAQGGGVRDALYEFHRGAVEAELGLSGPARRHLEQALRTAPAFSPLWAPEAGRALAELGEPVPAEAPAGVEVAADATG